MSLRIDCPRVYDRETPGRHKKYRHNEEEIRIKLSANEMSPVSPPYPLKSASPSPPKSSPLKPTQSPGTRISQIPEDSKLEQRRKSGIEISFASEEYSCLSMKTKKVLSIILLIIGIATLIIGALAFIYMTGMLAGALLPGSFAFMSFKMALGIGITAKISGLALVIGGGILFKNTD